MTEAEIRRQVTEDIYAALKKRRDAARGARERGWPLLTEAMVIALNIGDTWPEGCVCCGTQDNLMWRKGDHELAITTICRSCKFGACEVCR